MTPALWTELISALVTVSVALAAYLRANTANKTANYAQTSSRITSNALVSHYRNEHPLTVKGMNTVSETPVEVTQPAMSAPELTDPIGLQGSTLMGYASQAPVEAPAPAPEPEAVAVPEVPVVTAPETVPVVTDAHGVLDEIIAGLTKLKSLL